MSEERGKTYKRVGMTNKSPVSQVVQPFPKLFPHLAELARELSSAQSQFEQLRAENQNLKEQLERQDRELSQFRQQVTDLNAECESLKQQLESAKEAIDRSRNDALVSLFTDMADERHNRMLRKLLAFNDQEPELLRDLARYLRDDLKLSLDGELGALITLTEENLDHYELHEAVTLPCRAKVIGRGILFEGRPILRPKVEPAETEEDAGNGN